MPEQEITIFVDFEDDHGSIVELYDAATGRLDVAQVQAGGEARILLPDLPDEGTTLVARSPNGIGEMQFFAGADVPRMTVSKVVDAPTQFLGPEYPSSTYPQDLHEQPKQHHYGRVSPAMASRFPWLVAGSPDRGSFPTSVIPRRFTARYLEAEDNLHKPEPKWKEGKLFEYEITWESLGWSIDDWISTVVLAPGMEAALSDLDIQTTGNTGQTSDDLGSDGEDVAQRASSDADETMNAAAQSMASTRSTQLGIGANRSDTSKLTLDPVLALTQAVTGTLQLGFNAGSSSADAVTTGAIQRQLRSAITQETIRRRASHATSMVGATNDINDHRNVRIVRNTNNESLNLACYAMAREWLVTTAVSQIRKVVFVPIKNIDKEFTREEVFLHRATISAVLLDEELRDALEDVAARYVPGDDARQQDEPPSARPPDIKTIVGTIEFYDEAKGDGSNVQLEVVFDDHPEPDNTFRQTFTNTRPGTAYEIELQVNQPLARMAAVTLLFHNPGLIADHRTVVSRLLLTALLADGTRRDLHEWRAIELVANHKITKPAALQLSSSSAPRRRDERPDATARRLIAHLNNNAAYYRLAIDLKQDSVERFRTLAMTVSTDETLPMPSDFEPVGVAGAHLAFLLKDKLEPTDPPFKDLLSTPTEGTWLEAIPGAHSVAAPAKLPSFWPNLPSGKDESFPWPTPFQPTQAALAAPTSTVTATNGAAVTPATATPLTTADLDDLFNKVKQLIDERSDDAKKDENPTTGAGTDAGKTS